MGFAEYLPRYDTMYIEMAETDNKTGSFYRLSSQTLGLIDRICSATGVRSKTAIIEMAVFEKAITLGLTESSAGDGTATEAVAGDREWMTSEEVAAFLHVSPVTIRVYGREGKLNRYKGDGRSYRYKRSEVEAMLKPVLS
jgi:excisionase family DNA binding protein